MYWFCLETPNLIWIIDFFLGRGPDYENPSNININDVLGDYSLTLVDVLDTLAIMGNKTEFQKAVKLVLDHVNFDKSNTVQIFEANIRVLGGLLSAHLLMEDIKVNIFQKSNSLLWFWPLLNFPPKSRRQIS